MTDHRVNGGKIFNKKNRPGSAISILLLLGIVLINIPSSAAGISKSASVQKGSVTVPPQERILPAEQGLEKLSPDLQKMLDAAPVFNQREAYDLESGDPLLVSAMIEPGADVQRFFTRSVRSRQVAGFEWVTGEISLYQLRKLASASEVVGVISNQTYQTADAPGLDALRTSPAQLSKKQIRALLAQGGPKRLRDEVKKLRDAQKTTQQPERISVPQSFSQPAGAAIVQDLLDIHDVRPARAAGYSGQGVVVGVVDTGVDFSHPDLAGTQAPIKTDGPYTGWPFAYDTLSGYSYAVDQTKTIGPDNYWNLFGASVYVHTLPVEDPACSASSCTARLLLAGDTENGVYASFSWPDTSQSKRYYYSIYPDYSLALLTDYLGIGYPEGWLLSPVVIVSDEQQAGVYNSVYVDINYDHQLSATAERMTRDQPTIGVDLDQGEGKDGLWDLSAGMLGWISDGANQPPGVAMLYPSVAKKDPPKAGGLLVFINDQEGHGTSCASLIAGQGQITDPKGQGPSNPLYAGGADIGGVGGAVIPSIAPGAKIAAFQNGFEIPFASWTLAVLGMDGIPDNGDEVNVVSNSWGDSAVIADGWDPVSRFAQQLSYISAPGVTFLVATGNGGHGYGTRTSPGGGSIIDVGASTAYGSLRSFEFVGPEQFLYGEVQPWSNRGPGGLGDIAPDIVAVGAWGTAAIPLNGSSADAQRSYDVFGGTSMSTPVAAGSAAIVYQAFRDQHNRWPTWAEARNLLMASARDLGYDVLAQGSGNIQVSRAVDMALEHAPAFTPTQWQAGGYRGTKYPAFPAILHAGDQDTQQIEVRNPSADPVAVNLDSRILQNFHEETFTFAFSPPEPETTHSLPVFLKDISAWIDAYQPDFVRAQVVFPYSNFDVGNDGYPDNWWRVHFYDWMDLNKDGNLWTDTNRDGRVDENEIDIDQQTGLYEFNRFTYGYPLSDYLETSLGKQGLSSRHQGVFLGLSCVFCGESTNMQVRLTFYRNVPWGWLTLSMGSLQVPGQSSASLDAALAIPPETQPGVYEGAVVLNMAGKESLLPVIAHVAADTTTFRFGGPENPGLPYDNARVFGGFNWNWRYEAGDWRLFYMDFPDGSAVVGKSILVETLWAAPTTDIDSWLLGPSQGVHSREHPEIFGPQEISIAAGSVDKYVRNGMFHLKTNTGTSREVIGAPVQDGLNMISLHNVLNSGLQFAEEYIGRVFQVASDPGQVVITAGAEGNNPPYLSGSQQISITSTGDIDEGIQIQPFGMSPSIELPDQTVLQDSPSNICSSTWVYKKDEGGLVIRHGGLLEITTSAADPTLDLDLFLYQDNGDSVWSCGQDILKTYSINDNAEEQIKIHFPEDGRYWVVVLGNRVPGNKKTFHMNIRSISGTDLTLSNLPMDSIHANQPVNFTTHYYGKYPFTSPTALEGLLFIGTPAVPDLLEVPIRVQPDILLFPAPSLTPETRWVRQTPALFTLSVQNLGANPETIQAELRFPDGLVYEPGSANGPGSITYDPAANVITWNCLVEGGKTVVLAFRAASQPDFPPQQVELLAHVKGITSGQEWMVKTVVWINQYGMLFPWIRR